MIKNLLLLGYCVVDAFQLIIHDIIYFLIGFLVHFSYLNIFYMFYGLYFLMMLVFGELSYSLLTSEGVEIVGFTWWDHLPYVVKTHIIIFFHEPWFILIKVKMNIDWIK